jgi:hypothetical protein
VHVPPLREKLLEYDTEFTSFCLCKPRKNNSAFTSAHTNHPPTKPISSRSRACNPAPHAPPGSDTVALSHRISASQAVEASSKRKSEGPHTKGPTRGAPRPSYPLRRHISTVPRCQSRDSRGRRDNLRIRTPGRPQTDGRCK